MTSAGRLEAPLAERERGAVVAPAPGGLGQPPQRWRQPLQLGHLLAGGQRLPQQPSAASQSPRPIAR